MTGDELRAALAEQQKDETMTKPKDPSRLINALQAIAGMRIDENTNHAQLTALCIGIAKITLQEWCCDDAACYNESSGVACAILK